jgi:hypothetical protein
MPKERPSKQDSPSANIPLREYTARISNEADPTDRIGHIGYTALRGDIGTIGDRWLTSLHRDTTLNEVFLLMGVEEASDQTNRVYQLLEHAADSAIGIEAGKSVGDLLASDAYNIYEQLFHQD